MSAPPPLPLDVEERGEGRPLILVHGLGANRSTWSGWAPALAASRRVYLVDLKGHGAAPKPDDGRYGPLDQARLVTRWIVRRDLRDAVIIGHSMGGAVALLTEMLLRDEGEGGRIHGLVSVAGTAYPQPFPPYVSSLRRRWIGRLLLWAVPTGWLIRRVVRSVVYDPDAVTDAQIEAYATPLQTRAGRRALADAAAQVLPEDAEAWTRRYGEIEVPVLLVWGRQDGVVPLWVARRLESALPRARLVVVEACGHIPPQERPLESLRALHGFLDELE